MLRSLLNNGREPRRSALVIDGRSVPVVLKRHGSARRIIVRLDHKGEVVVTVPWHTSYAAALDFAASQSGWIWAQTQRKPETVPLRPGALVPLRGVEHVIVHHGGRRPVWTEPGDPPRLCLTGDPAHAERRMRDWLKGQARQDLVTASRAYAAHMGVRFASVTIRDTTSRWGSCSARGALSYSWRLILAPPHVLDYVAAHEVAHLIEMNHGPDFWALVEAHCPRAEEARRWLKTRGRDLHRYGAA